MIRRTQLHVLTPLTVACGALLGAVPALAAIPTAAGRSNSSGGASLSGPPGSGAGLALPAEATITATGNGITFQTLESGLLRGRLRFTGTVPSADAGDVVEIERRTTPSKGAWLPTAHATVTAGGAFSVVWQADRAGRFAIEAELIDPAATTAAAVSAEGFPTGGAGAAVGAAPAGPSTGPVSPALNIAVYRPSVATFYGPGFYGQHTACGQTLRRSTLGVASRTLKCGTKVSVLYRGRAIVVPVIDRGPYANGATWDLTMATANALGITATSVIGALPSA